MSVQEGESSRLCCPADLRKWGFGAPSLALYSALSGLHALSNDTTGAPEPCAARLPCSAPLEAAFSAVSRV